ncbi:uncharacterized protein LOC141950238 [Strix uralensis]|uniref:uncharacterized protein LOC141950238 n=1 Tax=Strix uralensis TaxID=36305 RepID=UPI003DA554AB
MIYSNNGSPLHSQTASVHPGSACVTPSAGEDRQATGVSEEEEGQEERMRKKYLTCQILQAVPRARAAFQGVVGPDDLQEFPSHLKLFCSSGVTAVTSRALSYHRREKVAPGFKAIPSACCFTPAAALLKKWRRKLWLTKLCHNRDCSRQHHGMLIMTSTGLAVLSFSLLLAVDLHWPLIRGKRLYNSKWSYKAAAGGGEQETTITCRRTFKGDTGPSGSPEQILERGLPEHTNASEGGAGAGPVAKHLPWLPIRKADTVGACGAATLPRRTSQHPAPAVITPTEANLLVPCSPLLAPWRTLHPPSSLRPFPDATFHLQNACVVLCAS